MTTDLSVCQDIFSRDPVRYVDMTEAVRRGVGTVLHASPSAALVGIPAAGCAGDFGSYLMSCADMDAARLLTRGAEGPKSRSWRKTPLPPALRPDPCRGRFPDRRP